MSKHNIEAIYPLSPIQQGLFFHSAYEPESAAYFIQHRWTIDQGWDAQAFKKAWQRVFERHAILRTAFVWEESGEALQVVRRRVRLPWEERNWSGLTASQQDERLKALLEQDRAQSFDLAKAPLMRLTLLKFSPDSYQFIWSYHHLLLDGWSVPLLLNEVFAYYAVFQKGEELEMEQPRPYSDYVAWLRRQDLSKAEVFWRKYLKGFTAPTPPGLDRRRTDSVEQDSGYDKKEIRLPNADRLQALARQNRLTLNTVIQGLWAILLSRYSGEEDIVFGVAASGRPAELSGSESMIGLFINTLPARVKVDGRLPLLEWLKQFQLQQAEARRYDHAPLVQVQGWSEVPRGTNLFDSIFMFENAALNSPIQDGQPQPGELKIRYVESFEKTNYALAVMAGISSQELSLAIGYHRSRFESSVVDRMFTHFTTLVEEVVDNPRRSISELQILSEGERNRLSREWNDTQTDYPADSCIHELVEAQAEKTPNAIAVVDEERQLTYEELNRRANQLARYLKALGVGPEIPVGICAERSIEMIVGMLGILKAGGAYVPLDHSFPPERLLSMIEDAEIELVLTQRSLSGLLDQRTRLIYLDGDWPALQGEDEQNLGSTATAENLAYIIYTSGSTGGPKGVLVPHQGLLNLVFWHRRTYEVTAADRSTQVASMSFDASVWELWPYLSAGATIYIADDEKRGSTRELREWLITRGITISFLPTPLAESVLRAKWPESVSLRAMLTGGDRLNQFAPEGLPFKLINNYGPTENTVVTTYSFVSGGSDECVAPPIGRPVANTRLFVMDAHQCQCPIGVPGELWIEGDSLARGYLHRPESTAESFAPSIYSKVGGARLYKTGDIVRYHGAGTLEYIGRKDQQVKIRGLRIELGEIEEAIRRHQAVRDVSVIAKEGAGGEKQLVAYIVANEEACAVSELISLLQQRLPPYMVPSKFLLLPSLPLTPNGKIDHRALPDPGSVRHQTELLPPRTEVERVLAGIWAEVLGVDTVSISDNFFELGGHSILAIQISAKANEAGLRFTIKQLLQSQTIERLAGVVDVARPRIVEEVNTTGSAPLTPVQSWFFERRFSEPHHFNMSLILELEKPIDTALLKRAIEEVAAHHQAFRHRFRQTEGGWEQFIVERELAVLFAEEDLSGLSELDQSTAMEISSSRAQSSLNFTEGPLMRVVRFGLGEGRSRLLMVVHHLVCDLISLTILAEDLEIACRQLISRSEVKLQPEAATYAAWARLLERYSADGSAEKDLQYWANRPWNAVAPLPLDYRDGENLVGTARLVEVDLSREETESLVRKVPRAYNTQISEVLLAALALAYERWTGETRLLVAVEGHGREEIMGDVDLSRTVGWFTAITPAILDIEGSSGEGETLKRVKQQLREIPNGGVGYGVFRYLSRNAEIVESTGANVDHEISFNYLGQSMNVGARADSLMRTVQGFTGDEFSKRNQRGFKLDVSGAISDGRLTMSWIYSENLHRRDSIESLAEHYLAALRSLIAHCVATKTGGYTPSDFKYATLSQSEIDELIDGLSPATG